MTNYKSENSPNSDSGFQQLQSWNSSFHIVQTLILDISSLVQTMYNNMQMMENHSHFIETIFIQLTKSFEAQSEAGNNRY